MQRKAGVYKPMNRPLSRSGLAVLLLSLAYSATLAEPSSRLEAGATTHHGEDMASEPGFTFGGSFALARWTPSEHLALVPNLGLLFARRTTTLVLAGVEQDPLSMDSLEIPLLLRGELTLGGRTFYALGGGYGGLQLRAQSLKRDGVVARADTTTSTDLGLIVGAGLELTSFAWGELFLEMRYQRSYRAIMTDENSRPELFSVLLGYGLGSDTLDSPSSWTNARSLALKGGFVATRTAGAADSEYGPGVSFGASLSPVRLGSRLALVPQFEVLLVHRSTESQGSGADSLGFDSMDSSALARGEFALAGKAIYGVGGAYASVLLRAQRTRDGVTTDVRDTLPAFDVGWIAGAGVEFTAATRTRLALEVRYQRSLRAATSASMGSDTLFCLFGISHGGVPNPGSEPVLPSHDIHPSVETLGPAQSSNNSGQGAAKRLSPRVPIAADTVLIGRPGDRWLHTMQFTQVKRAKRHGVYGYQVRYDISGHGTVDLFWPRDAIDFTERPTGSLLQSMKLRKGRLRYPRRITRRSLPEVHRAILAIEQDYAKQADGAVAAMEGFVVVAGLGSIKPTPRATSPRGSPRKTVRTPQRAKTRQSSSSSANSTTTGSSTQPPAATGTAARAVAPATRTVAPSSRALGRALVAAGHVRPPGSSAHHIVAGSAQRAGQARTILQRFGIGINDAANGVFLPATRASVNPTGAAVHSTLHTNHYYQAVNQILGAATTRADVEAALNVIRQALRSGGL